MDQKMERVTKTIIEQIDTLSSIATEFSNFAKMPKANFENINLHNILINSISLYRNLEYVQLEFKTEITGNAEVWADKEQLLRVFNNLIKNAVQSIPENRNGIIKIMLKREKNDLLVMITDNGIGIRSESISKIFVPNFTTKNGGMGLGLAMVKNILENANGRIWFETEVNKGTTFFVSIPAYKNEG
jgi:nitrogen fixation/metabolism regulation signal transduction histidine kinase